MTGEQGTVSFSQEFRLGLVVYGGVSLAIYMNGVCREFYEAVRGRGIYKLMKALTDSDIIVDIVSGTSAGGINGILLSYALTNSTQEQAVEFSSFANIWRESGDINKLLREVDPFKISGDTNSVLDGEGYYQTQLFQALQNAKPQKVENPDREWFSASNELDLFVTGTDVLGKIYNRFDNTSRVIEVKDHRCVFHLKYRQNRKHPFEPTRDAQTALAKLCRITSCFPVAFPVVCVKLDDPQDPDARLVEWGALKNRFLPPQDAVPAKNRDQGSRQLYFVDGGVLDNRPFGYTIQEIYYRTAHRPVSRKLFYIDPSPDRFLDGKTYQEMPKPNLIQVAGDSLVSMPRYESIANDLKAIEEHNQKVRRYRRLAETVQQITFQGSGSSGSPVESDAEYLYLRCRLIELRDRVLPLILQTEKFSDQGSATRVTGQILEKRQLLEKTAALFARAGLTAEQKAIRETVLRDLTQQMRNLDVEYAIRKHFFLLERVWQIMEVMLKSHQIDKILYQQLKFLAGDLSKQIELLEVVRAALAYLLQQDAVNRYFCKLLTEVEQQITEPANSAQAVTQQPIYKIYDYLLRLHRFLLDSRGLKNFQPTQAERTRPINPLVSIPQDFLTTWGGLTAPADPQTPQPYGLSIAQISSIFAQLKQRAAELETQPIWGYLSQYDFKGNENDSDQYQSLLRRIELRSEDLIQLHCDQIQNLQTNQLLEEFKNFRHVDQVLYSYEYLANFHSKETIELFRISPDDARRGFSQSKPSDAKLAGDQLRAFGGFFKRAWRSNDILWGRLDGLNRLVDALLTPDSLSNFPGFVQRQLDQTNLTEALQQLLADTLPASATAQEKMLLLQLLEKLAKGKTLSDEPEGELEQLRNLLVMIGHREIVETDLDKVFQDEIEEQMSWEVQRVPAQAEQAADSAKAPQYVPANWGFSESMNPLIAKSLALDAIKQLDKTQFFQNQYRVGTETLGDGVPSIVLKNLLARTGLILRNVISGLSSEAERNRQLGQSSLFQTVNRILQVFYILVQRKSPRAFQPAAGRKASLLNFGVILLGLILIGLVIIVTSLVAIFLQLPIWALTALGAAILLLSLLLLKWA